MDLLAYNGRWYLNKVNRPVSRWAEWARSFSDRLQPASRSGKNLQLVLRMHCAAVPEGTRVLQRPHLFQQLFARIYLAINSVLKINTAVSTKAVNEVTRNLGESITVHPIWKQVLATGEGQSSLKARKVGVGSVRNRPVLSELKWLGKRVGTRPMLGIGSDHVFERRIHCSTTLTEMCHRTVRRVLEKCERVEERPRQSLVLRREVQAAVATTSDSRLKEIIATSPWGISVGKSGFAMTDGQMPIDLNRLTDQVVRQIDDRMVAHRERMGTVF